MHEKIVLAENAFSSLTFILCPLTQVNSPIPKEDREVGCRNGDGKLTLDCVAFHQALDICYILKI